MASTVLITGASTGIGNLTARSLALAGYTVYASMRDITGKNKGHAHDLQVFAESHNLKLKVIVLDVQSQDSADIAVKTVLDEAGQLDVVVHNAGHLVIGYVEAFKAEDFEHLFDINVFGMQRVNRAALPHMRERRSGTLLYIGSTSVATLPPFLAPYVASKAAFDVLASTTAYEVGRFGIETTMVMPGPFTSGTEHFPNATRVNDPEVARAYAFLDGTVADTEEITRSLFTPGVDATPQAVADEVVRILALPIGQKPVRTVVDFSEGDVEAYNATLEQTQRTYLTRMGLADLFKTDPSNTAPRRP